MIDMINNANIQNIEFGLVYSDNRLFRRHKTKGLLPTTLKSKRSFGIKTSYSTIYVGGATLNVKRVLSVLLLGVYNGDIRFKDGNSHNIALENLLIHKKTMLGNKIIPITEDERYLNDEEDFLS